MEANTALTTTTESGVSESQRMSVALFDRQTDRETDRRTDGRTNEQRDKRHGQTCSERAARVKYGCVVNRSH